MMHSLVLSLLVTIRILVTDRVDTCFEEHNPNNMDTGIKWCTQQKYMQISWLVFSLIVIARYNTTQLDNLLSSTTIGIVQNTKVA